MNIYSVFQACFPHDENASFIETADGRLVSYGELQSRSAQLANRLRALGVNKGDRVAVQVDKSPEVLFLYLAVLRMGAIYLPLNTAYTDNEIDYFLGNATPTVFVCRPQAEAGAQALGKNNQVAHVLTLGTAADGSLMDDVDAQSSAFDTVDCEDDDIGVILYTSGTTGRPKGAMISHRNLEANARTLHSFWQWRPGDVLLHALPIFHIHGLFVACHCVLLNGSKMIFLEKFDIPTVLKFLPQSTVMMGVPTYYVRLLASAEFSREHCKNMRLFISGSAPLLEQTFDEFRERTGLTILERYGMTETGMNTSNPVDGERLPGTVGPPLPGVTVRIVNDNDEEVAPGEIGSLLVKGGNVFKGYWQMPEKTAEEFTADGFFRTGDLSRQDENGYVSIVGRGKDLVISGGLNVYPKEVEFEIDQMDGVKESAVIGMPHPDFGEAVTAVVVLEPGSTLSEQEVIQHIKNRLANFKVPKAVHFVDALPRNTMGKVQKNVLREQYAS